MREDKERPTQQAKVTIEKPTRTAKVTCEWEKNAAGSALREPTQTAKVTCEWERKVEPALEPDPKNKTQTERAKEKPKRRKPEAFGVGSWGKIPISWKKETKNPRSEGRLHAVERRQRETHAEGEGDEQLGEESEGPTQRSKVTCN